MVVFFTKGKGLRCILLLQQRVTDIAFVAEQIADAGSAPLFPFAARADTLLIEHIGNRLSAQSLQIQRKNAPDNGSLRFIDLQLSVDQAEPIRGIGTVKLPGCHPLPVAPTHIPRYGQAFLLCGHTGECDDHFIVHSDGVNALFLKEHADAVLREHPQCCKQFLRIARKA